MFTRFAFRQNSFVRLGREARAHCSPKWKHVCPPRRRRGNQPPPRGLAGLYCVPTESGKEWIERRLAVYVGM